MAQKIKNITETFQNVTDQKESNALFLQLESLRQDLAQKNKRLEEFEELKSEKKESIDKVLQALSMAQKEMPIVVKDKVNSYLKSKYVSLTSVIEITRPYLWEQDLSVVQSTDIGSVQGFIMKTVLMHHKSRQSITSIIPISPNKTDIQSLGASITYLRKYQYVCLIGVLLIDNDDDGEILMDRSLQSTANKREIGNKISIKQVEDIAKKLSGNMEIFKVLSKEFSIQKISDLTTINYLNFCKRTIELQNIGKENA